MERLLSNLKFAIPEKIYVKDPESSNLGKRIVEHSILLIDEMGFEAFTFKKLGEEIGSNESSIYRYFVSKHNLLLYLSSWYWCWMEYQLVLETYSLSNGLEKLKKSIEILTRTVKEDLKITHVNEVVLNRIMINENSKSFLTKSVDKENKDGIFAVYKRIIIRLSEILNEVNPKYKYANSLASTIVEGSLHQHFLKDHFTSITDCKESVSPSIFFEDLALNVLNES